MATKADKLIESYKEADAKIVELCGQANKLQDQIDALNFLIRDREADRAALLKELQVEVEEERLDWGDLSNRIKRPENQAAA